MVKAIKEIAFKSVVNIVKTNDLSLSFIGASLGLPYGWVVHERGYDDNIELAILALTANTIIYFLILQIFSYFCSKKNVRN